MRRMFWIVVVAVPTLACNYTEGQCWIDGQAEGSFGAGGGPIVPGWGGSGDVPAEPQDIGDPPPPDCNITKDTVCNEKCLASYVGAVEKCTEIKDAAQKRSCDDDAYSAYRSCRENCQSSLNACYDKCDAIADKEREKCNKMPPGPGQAKCNQAVQEQWAACYEECRKKE